MGMEQHAKFSITPLVSESSPVPRLMRRWPAVTDRFTVGSHVPTIEPEEPSGHAQPIVRDALGCSLYAPSTMKEFAGSDHGHG